MTADLSAYVALASGTVLWWLPVLAFVDLVGFPPIPGEAVYAAAGALLVASPVSLLTGFALALVGSTAGMTFAYVVGTAARRPVGRLEAWLTARAPKTVGRARLWLQRLPAKEAWIRLVPFARAYSSYAFGAESRPGSLARYVALSVAGTAACVAAWMAVGAVTGSSLGL